MAGGLPLCMGGPQSTHISSRRRRKAKSHKVHEGKIRYVLGCDIYMELVKDLFLRALIDKLEYYQLGRNSG